MALPLPDLPAGYTFDAIVFTIDAGRAGAYRAAVDDATPLDGSDATVPPLAVAAFALGAILNQVGLPPGSLHGSESVEFRLPVPAGASVECRARLAQRSQRSGWIVSVIDSDLLLDGRSALTARATVLCPASPA